MLEDSGVDGDVVGSLHRSEVGLENVNSSDALQTAVSEARSAEAVVVEE